MSRADDQEFERIARALSDQDPEFVRRVSAPAPARAPRRPSMVARLTAGAERRWEARRTGRPVPPWLG